MLSCVDLVSVAGLPESEDAGEDELAADETAPGEVDERSPKVPGFFLWLAFVWVGVPATLAALGIHVPEHL
jgi:hypothetical protein